ncbi:type III secretion system export apparatus subunit SctT [Castellaniella defragrans]|uniref:Type III secretion protein T n=1 Tax=Castellaniella defragrans TaxID=75697 RepID=A0A7W9TS16_CASDE|nr:type III secretion system export apparatus subunit SctT [Castellaniella defragrans]KAB0614671.1 EscT/YscT/HrcT family type III secretion system export apparatus protein [Castellaniella defragrans]MBB6084943.1 type III secretion protein T [Castellaniella defragrans]
MFNSAATAEIHVFLGSWALTQPRLLALCGMLPLFNRQLLPGLLRYALCAALGLVLVPMVMPRYAGLDLGAAGLLLLVAKEVFVGLVLGFMVALPFWIFEAVGFIVDNQRGASLGAVINPATGNDSSPLGILFNQAFLVFFLVGGGFTLMLTLLYDSFRLWDLWSWSPALRADSIPLMLDQLSRFMRLVLLFAAPAVVAMFLAELGLALVSRFAPQLQVFFLAMPIKSALALLVLVLYMDTLFGYAGETVRGIPGILPFLDGQWRHP